MIYDCIRCNRGITSIDNNERWICIPCIKKELSALSKEKLAELELAIKKELERRK